jgi:hypothetical protein
MNDPKYIVDLQVLFITITREFTIAYVFLLFVVSFISQKNLSKYKINILN